MKRPFTTVLLTCLLAACASDPPAMGNSASDTPATGLALVAGDWRLSHFGEPTVRDKSVPNPAKEVKKHLSGTTIAIEQTGQLSLVAPGHAGTQQVGIIEETPLYLKIGDKERPSEEAFVYERASGLLMMPGKLLINGNSGVLPTYFKRMR